MSKVICITGMHRSGTSLTASWLQNCGLQIDYGKLIGASVGNVKGHFEDVDFVNLQSKTIKNEIEASKGWIVDKETSLVFPQKDLKEAKRIIEQRNRNFEIWGWKDPRSALFLDHWKKLNPDLKFIFVWRSSHSVVRSLEKRYKKSGSTMDKIGTIQSYKTWLNYNSAILDFFLTYQEDCLLINIADLINKDEEFLRRINYLFESKLKYSPIKNLVDPSLLTFKLTTFKDSLFGKLLNTESLEKRLSHYSFKNYN